MAYDNDYCTFDDFGLKEVRCLACNTPIIIRDYIELPSHSIPGETVKVMAMKRLSKHTEMSVRISDGSRSELPHCTDCVNLPLDVNKATVLIHNAWKEEMVRSGKPTERVTEVMANLATRKPIMKEKEFQARKQRESKSEQELVKDILAEQGDHNAR